MKKILFFFILAITISALRADRMLPDEGETGLMTACRSASPQQVEEIISKGANVNTKTKIYWKTALDYAIENPKPFDIASILLKHGADLSRSPKLLKNILFFQYSKDEKKDKQLEKLILLLIDKKAPCDPDEILGLAANKCTNLQILQKLIDAGANVNSRTIGYPPLISALEGKSNEAVLKFLIEHGADPNIRNPYDDKPASYFAKNNEILALLIKYGADLSADSMGAFDKDGTGPVLTSPYERFLIKPIPLLNAWSKWIDTHNLAVAIEKGCVIDEEGMINSGANPLLPQIYNQLLKAYKKTPPIQKMCQKATEYGNIENIKFLKLKASELNIDIKTDLFTPALQLNTPISEEKQKTTVKYLVKSTEDINLQDYKTGKTALMKEASKYKQQNIELLLKNGADPTLYDTNGFNVLFYFMANGSFNTPKEKLNTLDCLLKHGAQLKQKNTEVNLLIIALASEQPPEIIEKLVELGENVNFKTSTGITPLMIAAMFYKKNTVKILLEKGAKINDYDLVNWSPLFYACHYFFEPEDDDVGSFHPRNRSKKDGNAVIQLLLKNGAKATTLDDFGASALTEAAAWANSDTIKQLINAGGKKVVNASDRHNRNAIFYAANCNQDIQAVEALLEAGANPNTMMKTGKFPARIMEIKTDFNDFHEGKNLYVENGQEFHNSAGYGWYDPPIFTALRKKNMPLLKLLLKYGADPNIKYIREGSSEYTPLMYAHNDEFKNTLIKAGAKTDKKESYSPEFKDQFTTACARDNIKEIKTLYSSLKSISNEDKESLLEEGLKNAAWQGTLEAVMFLINENGGTFNDDILVIYAAANEEHPEIIQYLVKLKPESLEYREDKYKNSAMHYAANNKTIEFLISKGMSPDIENERGWTPLINWFLCEDQLILENNNKQLIIESLIKNGANLNFQSKTQEKITPLSAAMLTHNLDEKRKYIKYMLKHGANPNIISFDNIPILLWSIKKNNTREFELLIEAGADIRLFKGNLSQCSPYLQRRIKELQAKAEAK